MANLRTWLHDSPSGLPTPSRAAPELAPPTMSRTRSRALGIRAIFVAQSRETAIRFWSFAECVHFILRWFDHRPAGGVQEANHCSAEFLYPSQPRQSRSEEQGSSALGSRAVTGSTRAAEGCCARKPPIVLRHTSRRAKCRRNCSLGRVRLKEPLSTLNGRTTWCAEVSAEGVFEYQHGHPRPGRAEVQAHAVSRRPLALQQAHRGATAPEIGILE